MVVCALSEDPSLDSNRSLGFRWCTACTTAIPCAKTFGILGTLSLPARLVLVVNPLRAVDIWVPQEVGAEFGLKTWHPNYGPNGKNGKRMQNSNDVPLVIRDISFRKRQLHHPLPRDRDIPESNPNEKFGPVPPEPYAKACENLVPNANNTVQLSHSFYLAWLARFA